MTNARDSGSRRDNGGGRVTDYHINSFFSKPDGGYIADILDLEACSAFGADF